MNFSQHDVLTLTGSFLASLGLIGIYKARKGKCDPHWTSYVSAIGGMAVLGIGTLVPKASCETKEKA